VLAHSVFGVWIGVPEPVSDWDTRYRDHECKEEDRHEGVKDVVHSVVLVFLVLVCCLLDKKRNFQILETITNDKKNLLFFVFLFLSIPHTLCRQSNFLEE
jgi:hypothetical protein